MWWKIAFTREHTINCLRAAGVYFVVADFVFASFLAVAQWCFIKKKKLVHFCPAFFHALSATHFLIYLLTIFIPCKVRNFEGGRHQKWRRSFIFYDVTWLWLLRCFYHNYFSCAMLCFHGDSPHPTGNKMRFDENVSYVMKPAHAHWSSTGNRRVAWRHQSTASCQWAGQLCSNWANLEHLQVMTSSAVNCEVMCLQTALHALLSSTSLTHGMVRSKYCWASRLYMTCFSNFRLLNIKGMKFVC